MLATISGKMEGPNQSNRFSVFQKGLGEIFKVSQKGLGSILEGLGLDFRSFPRRFGLDFKVFQEGLVHNVNSMFKHVEHASGWAGGVTRSVKNYC